MALPSGYRFPDVSHFRPVADWGAFSRYPVSAAKATEGATWTDPEWTGWLAEMRRRGLTPIGYHFLRRGPTIDSQVANYLRAVKGGPVGVILDVETAGDGSNPTMAQANAWINQVTEKLGIRRSQVLVYIPRWWWLAHGGSSRALADTILWNSHYTTSPFIGAYAGGNTEIIQYSSSAPIAGVSQPGDMNIAIGMTAAGLRQKILDVPEEEPDVLTDEQDLLLTRIAHAVIPFYQDQKPGDGRFQVQTLVKRATAAQLGLVLARLAALQSAVDQLGAGGSIDYGRVEQAAEQAVRDVLGSLDEAT